MQRFLDHPKQVVFAAIVFILLVAILGSAQISSDPLLIRENGKYGYVDRTGKILIEPRFLMADLFNNGFAQVYDEEKGQYIIDGSGKEYIIPNAASFGFSEGLIQVKYANKWIHG